MNERARDVNHRPERARLGHVQVMTRHDTPPDVSSLCFPIRRRTTDGRSIDAIVARSTRKSARSRVAPFGDAFAGAIAFDDANRRATKGARDDAE